MLDEANLIALRMRRQCLSAPADKAAYEQLYRDVSPVQSVYWHGFGQPPCMTFRTAFDELEYNRVRGALQTYKFFSVPLSVVFRTFRPRGR